MCSLFVNGDSMSPNYFVAKALEIETGNWRVLYDGRDAQGNGVNLDLHQLVGINMDTLEVRVANATHISGVELLDELQNMEELERDYEFQQFHELRLDAVIKYRA